MLEIVRVVVPDLLADNLLGHLIDILVVADVDGSMDEKQIDEFAMVLLNDFLEQSVSIWVSLVLEQVLGYSIVILRTELDVAKRVLRDFL